MFRMQTKHLMNIPCDVTIGTQANGYMPSVLWCSVQKYSSDLNFTIESWTLNYLISCYSNVGMFIQLSLTNPW